MPGTTFIGDQVDILEREVQEWCKHWQVDEAQQGREALEALSAMTSPNADARAHHWVHGDPGGGVVQSPDSGP